MKLSFARSSFFRRNAKTGVGQSSPSGSIPSQTGRARLDSYTRGTDLAQTSPGLKTSGLDEKPERIDRGVAGGAPIIAAAAGGFLASLAKPVAAAVLGTALTLGTVVGPVPGRHLPEAIFSGVTSAAPKATLTWEAPTMHEDGTRFRDENGDGIIDGIKGYIVYRGSTSRANAEYAESRDIGMPSCANGGGKVTCTYTWDRLFPGTHYFAVKAYKEVPGQARSISRPSGEVAKTVR